MTLIFFRKKFTQVETIGDSFNHSTCMLNWYSITLVASLDRVSSKMATGLAEVLHIADMVKSKKLLAEHEVGEQKKGEWRPKQSDLKNFSNKDWKTWTVINNEGWWGSSTWLLVWFMIVILSQRCLKFQNIHSFSCLICVGRVIYIRLERTEADNFGWYMLVNNFKK